MALPAALTWEVRPGVGVDTSGGGFVTGASGTDYSKQDAPQYNATDLVIDASVNTKVRSASHNFVAADVGNLINISAGASWTAGFYQIVSVASNDATLDRSPGATSLTGGTYAVGGALATLAKCAAAFVTGHTVHVKATGTITTTATLTIPGNSGVTNITICGYTSVRGDNGQVTWTIATSSVDLCNLQRSWGFLLKNFRMSNTAGARGYGFYANSSSGETYGATFVNCNFDGFTSAVRFDPGAFFQFSRCVMIDCEVKNSVGFGILACAGSILIGCYIHNNGNSGYKGLGNFAAAPSVFTRCTFKANTNHGVEINDGNESALALINCNFDANTVDGVKLVTCTNPYTLTLVNNIFKDQGGWAVNGNGKTLAAVASFNNAFKSNASGNYSGLPPSQGDITLSADPFTSTSTHDYSLNSNAGGGAACKAAGIPSVMPI